MTPSCSRRLTRRQHVEAVMLKRSAISAADRDPCSWRRASIRRSTRSRSGCNVHLLIRARCARYISPMILKKQPFRKIVQRPARSLSLDIGVRRSVRGAFAVMEISSMREFDAHELVVFGDVRSEERRVGKEGGSGGE